MGCCKSSGGRKRAAKIALRHLIMMGFGNRSTHLRAYFPSLRAQHFSRDRPRKRATQYSETLVMKSKIRGVPRFRGA
jgi:hypothetical protein